jgi:hypothetical protein
MTNDALAVYYTFPMKLKVDLLDNPHGRVPADLIPRLSQVPGTSAVSQAVWLSNPPRDPGFRLAGELPDQLEHARIHLDNWWETLDPEVRDHFIENRDSEIDGHFKGAVMCAGDGKPDGLIVAVVQDEKTGGFRLPPMVDVYVELKARQSEN